MKAHATFERKGGIYNAKSRNETLFGSGYST